MDLRSDESIARHTEVGRCHSLVHRSDVSDEHPDEFCIVLCILSMLMSFLLSHKNISVKIEIYSALSSW